MTLTRAGRPPLEALDDGALVALAATRSEDGESAFQALFERHRDEVFAFLARLAGDDALAEDLLQETFLRVFRGLEGRLADRSFRAWVFQIARNAAIDAHRVRAKERRLAEASARRASDEDAPASHVAQAREEAEHARAGLDALPVEVRALLVQRHALGMSLGELAESYACTDRTVLTRLRAAVTLLARNIVLARREGGRS